jgi:hypothetical protein
VQNLHHKESAQEGKTHVYACKGTVLLLSSLSLLHTVVVYLTETLAALHVWKERYK